MALEMKVDTNDPKQVEHTSLGTTVQSRFPEGVCTLVSFLLLVTQNM